MSRRSAMSRARDTRQRQLVLPMDDEELDEIVRFVRSRFDGMTPDRLCRRTDWLEPAEVAPWL